VQAQIEYVVRWTFFRGDNTREEPVLVDFDEVRGGNLFDCLNKVYNQINTYASANFTPSRDDKGQLIRPRPLAFSLRVSQQKE